MERHLAMRFQSQASLCRTAPYAWVDSAFALGYTGFAAYLQRQDVAYFSA
jgi:hypothetical protein